jgi:hypothetical protein
MAPTPSASVPCGEKENTSESPGHGGNVTTRQVLDVMTDLSTRAAKNVSLQYYNLKEDVNITEDTLGRTTRAFYDEDRIPEDSYLYHNGIWTPGNMTNFSSLEEINYNDQIPPSMSRLHEFQIIKAVVLAAVTVVILISICKMVFQLFVRYTVKHDK